MRTIVIVFSIIIVAVMAFASRAYGQESVVISEVAWMGTASSTSNEWIEIYNASDEAIDLTGWMLEAVDGKPTIDIADKATGSVVIPAGGFFLLERTDDASVPGIPADVIYAGTNALSNGGEILILKDSYGIEIDKIDGSDGWRIGGAAEPIGDNQTKETAQRTNSGWVTAESTPRTTNKSLPPPPLEPEPDPSPTPTEEPAPTPAPTLAPLPEDLPLSEPVPESQPEASPPVSTSESEAGSPAEEPAPDPLPLSEPTPVSSTFSSTPPAKTVTTPLIPSKIVQNETPQESVANDENAESQEAIAAVATPLKKDSGGNTAVLWIVVIVLLALNAGLLYIIRTQRKRSSNRDVSLE